MTSRCSVISRSENKSCADGHRVYWFSAGTENANPSFVYAHEECEKENGSVQKCVHAFSKNVSSSDAGTDSCAVAACEEIFMGNAIIEGKYVIFSRARLQKFKSLESLSCWLCFVFLFCFFNLHDPEGSGCDFQMTVIFVLEAALALNVIVSAFLIYKIKTKTCFYCQACQRTYDQTRSRMQQRNEDSLVYSAPTIFTRKSGKASPTSMRTMEDFSTYTEVCLRESKRDENDETA
ncbi:uncharacterized protein LOC127591208 isoform X2 [Hippocampus zosterae]|nr:uncharacterized protein LOC127591208 isoform X2 [Hippocampus zosterae]